MTHTPTAVGFHSAKLRDLLPVAIAGALFAVLFAEPASTLLQDWWSNPDAGHGLLLAPVAGWLAWRSRPRAPLSPSARSGYILLSASIVLRCASGLAAELFTMRLSMVGAAAALVLHQFGWIQLKRWWLPFALIILAIPLPEVLLSAIAFPLQLKASRIGAFFLEMRHVPIRLEGNLILLPGHRLFVTEACSGLRSLTALLSLALLAGGLWLQRPVTRLALVAVAIPIAVLLNGFRVFLTGFLVYFVDAEFGTGFMHMTEGWLMFAVAFGLLAGTAVILGRAEDRWRLRS